MSKESIELKYDGFVTSILEMAGQDPEETQKLIKELFDHISHLRQGMKIYVSSAMLAAALCHLQREEITIASKRIFKLVAHLAKDIQKRGPKGDDS